MNADAPLEAVRPLTDAALRVAVIVPCWNEALTIGKVAGDFRNALPGAAVYVYDNNSSDGSAAAAHAAGAIVRRETLQGKGNVIRRAFADVEADIYVLVDGDDTYDAASAPGMLRLMIEQHLDMVTGRRAPGESDDAFRRGHRFGNSMLTGAVRLIFGDRISDMLSGYRVFSRRFVKSFPALADGFETETEFTIHALELRMPIGELPTPYKARPEGSVSKLRSLSDGLRILRTIVTLVKDERPLPFFSLIGLILLLVALGLGIPIILEFLHTGLVPRFPTAILATGLVVLSFLSFASSLILDSVARGRKEAKRIAYLSVPAIGITRNGGNVP